eukprot:ANDGO_08486.mRNA.1 6-phosphogluconate dehydrogenase
MAQSVVGLIGLAVMGQNVALNIAEKGFPISVFNRTVSRVDDTVKRAEEEGHGKFPLKGFHDLGSFAASLERPRRIIMLVKAGAAVDEMIDHVLPHLESGDILIDAGNEWFLNSERRAKYVWEKKGIRYMAMGVSGGEEGARHGPSLMPGGPKDAYHLLEPVLTRIAAQVDDGPCVTYIGERGSGNYVKMVHNGIEYGDMELIAEAYDILKTLGSLSNEELAEVFSEWNRGELKSFLVEITAKIFSRKDDLVDKILDKSGTKGTGKMTVQEAAERAVAAGTISAALDARYLSNMKDERVAASRVYPSLQAPKLSESQRKQLVEDVRHALYASKICSYAQGMALLSAASAEFKWDLQMGNIARIWKGGCIIRAIFLDRITKAFRKESALKNLLMDEEFAAEIREREAAWRRVITQAISAGLPVPSFSASLAYFDTYRRERVPANLIQAQRDFFGAHTFERVDKPGSFHEEWSRM